MVCENEYAGVESGGVESGAEDMAMATLTENRSYMTPREEVTSFTIIAEEDKVDNSYE